MPSNAFAVFELARQRQAEIARKTMLGQVELVTSGRHRRRRKRQT